MTSLTLRAQPADSLAAVYSYFTISCTNQTTTTPACMKNIFAVLTLWIMYSEPVSCMLFVFVSSFLVHVAVTAHEMMSRSVMQAAKIHIEPLFLVTENDISRFLWCSQLTVRAAPQLCDKAIVYRAFQDCCQGFVFRFRSKYNCLF